VQALTEQWGESDVSDIAAGIRHVAKSGWCDPDRVAVVGGSAGGMTALMLCAREGLVRAGVSLYRVTDLFELAASTHRFESRYLDRLVGELPRHSARYRDRSPIARVGKIRVPLLVLQGSEDPVVSPVQARELVAALSNSGIPVEYHEYEGEGHGWRAHHTIVDELERTEAFLMKWVIQR